MKLMEKMSESPVKTKCTDANWDTIDFDGLQCLFYVAGFQGPDFAEYDLTAECQLIKSYKNDSGMLSSSELYSPKNKISKQEEVQAATEG
ncbi:hypothetical protein OSTOST_04925 [Ostertagia ostertagi]